MGGWVDGWMGVKARWCALVAAHVAQGHFPWFAVLSRKWKGRPTSDEQDLMQDRYRAVVGEVPTSPPPPSPPTTTTTPQAV